MDALRNYLKAFHKALGPKGEIFGVLILLFSSYYENVQAYLSGMGITVLPELHELTLTIVVGLGILAFSFWRRLVYLEDKFIPKIKMHEPFFWTEPKNAPGKALRTYRLRIENLSVEAIKHCQVKLIDMVNKDNGSTRESGKPFKLSIENPPDILNTSLTQSFNISPMDKIDVDIVQFNETKPDTHIRMCYATQGPTDLNVGSGIPVVMCPHNLTIRAIAENSMPVDRQFKFYVDENGILQFEVV